MSSFSPSPSLSRPQPLLSFPLSLSFLLQQTLIPFSPARFLPTRFRSPVHYYVHGRNGAFVLQAPLVLGHEAGGKITALPASYKGDLKVGDDVAIEAGVNCNKCKYCREGRYNLCSVSLNERRGLNVELTSLLRFVFVWVGRTCPSALQPKRSLTEMEPFRNS